MKNRLLRRLFSATEYWARLDEREKEMDVYQKCLEVEPGSERIYLGLMSCYAKGGLRGEAAALYRRYIDSVVKAFGTTPSRRIEEIHDRIIGKD